MTPLLTVIKTSKYRWLASAIGICGFILFILFLIPLPENLVSPPWATAVFSREGKLLDVKIATDEQWRFPASETLPEKYVQAVLLFEDRHFYFHPGFNPVAIGRAAIDNWKAGHVVSGASTITMQVARIALDRPERTYFNKLREVWMAIRLELQLSKNEILKLYASHAPLGRNIVGLPAASWFYFGRAPDELSWAEAALLAVLPNRPSMLHLNKNRSALKERRDQLLGLLHAEGKLTNNDYQLALLEPLPEPSVAWPANAPHLIERLIRKYPGQSFFHTTLDEQLQADMVRLAQHHGRALAAEGVRNIALLVVDHQTMETIAYVGNSTEDVGSRDVDIAIRPRSTASVLKPLLYAAMLQDGELLPTMLVPDVPTTYSGFSPENNDREYRGNVPARQMVAQSLNVPAVYLLKQYGVERFREKLQDYGLGTINRSADNYGLSLILGGAEATLWDLTSVYANMAHVAMSFDQSHNLQPVSLLTSSAQLPSDSSPFPVHSGAAWLTLQAMTDVVRPGADTFWRYYENNQMIAWKTGTSYGLRDGWAIGVNGRYTVGIWTGNADGTPAASLGGAHSAGPILMEAFALLGNSPWIVEPVQDLKTVQVCDDDGYLANATCNSVEIQMPFGSHFDRTSPYHQRIFLSLDGHYRVHPGCAKPSTMQPHNWFVLPPTQEYFWKQHHSEYRTLPPWRKDCIASLQQFTGELPFDLIYPDSRNMIYLPLDMDGKLSRAIFRAVHRDPNAILHWHIDSTYLGKTQLFHEKTIRAKAGDHRLILVDQNGQRLERSFKILDPQDKKS